MKDKVLRLIEEILQAPEGAITPETKIADVEEWDSLAHVMIIGALEERLGVGIPLDEAVEITCVQEILDRCQGRTMQA